MATSNNSIKRQMVFSLNHHSHRLYEHVPIYNLEQKKNLRCEFVTPTVIATSIDFRHSPYSQEGDGAGHVIFSIVSTAYF